MHKTYALKDYTKLWLNWCATGDRNRPYVARTADGERLSLYIGEFPEEPMYTLYIGEADQEQVVGDIEDWPQSWNRLG